MRKYWTGIVSAYSGGCTKEEILGELVELLARSGQIGSVEDLRERISHREQLMSTGIGLGIAVPHVRMEGVKRPTVALGISREGIPDYESIDDKPVRVVVMIAAGKDQHWEYIRLLSQIVSKFKVKGVVEDLTAAGSPDEVYDVFVEERHV